MPRVGRGAESHRARFGMVGLTGRWVSYRAVVTLRGDLERTRLRIAESDRCGSVHVPVDGGLCRGRGTACGASALRRRDASFRRGRPAHVGRHCDVVENGRTWRAVVPGVGTGGEPGRVPPAERWPERQSVTGGDSRSREPHGEGAASALRPACGGEPAAAPAGRGVRLGGRAAPAAGRGCLSVDRRRASLGWPFVRIDSPVTRVRVLAPNLAHARLAGAPVHPTSFGHRHQTGPHSSLHRGRSFPTPCPDCVVIPAPEWLARGAGGGGGSLWPVEGARIPAREALSALGTRSRSRPPGRGCRDWVARARWRCLSGSPESSEIA